MMVVMQRIIAVGSPHGDDLLAWKLVERLQAGREINASVIALSDPSRLHDHVEGCERLVVVDACAGGGVPGTVTRLEWPDPRIAVRHSHSTHGLGVAGTLQLEQQLDRLPPKVVLFGIELEQCQPGDALSDVVENALDALEEKILQEIQ